jgi:hypothetical protein
LKTGDGDVLRLPLIFDNMCIDGVANDGVANDGVANDGVANDGDGTVLFSMDYKPYYYKP